MADPVIISYARGLLKEFPGIPEGIIDVIPVDLVVAAILAVAARGPLAEPDVFHAASGARNPLRYRQLVDLVQDWFIGAPAGRRQGPADRGAGVVLPGPRAGCSASCARPPGPCGAPSGPCRRCPLRGRQADLAARLEERRDEAERALGYVELYGAYTETEAVFSRRPPARAVRQPARRRPARSSASTPPSSTGPSSATTCTSRPWSPTPGSAWPPARRQRPGAERA